MSAKDVAVIAIFAGITAVLGFIPPIIVPISPVPITAQTLGVMLAGAIIGWRRATLAMVLVIALVAIGLPLLAGGRGGLGVFVGPTVGFLLGWIPSAALIGLATEKLGYPYVLWKGIGVNVLFGILVLYVFGLAGMMLAAKLTLTQALIANVAYLIGDGIKCVLAALIAKGVHTAYPGLLPQTKPVS